ncbi:MAG: hypothetical protein N3A66_09070, partial [Planctomycetota bacterium]|nr:hypothetical protein [Planctomycetota bacterium]
DLAEVERRLAVARKTYDERNRRLASLTDEAVDVFYSCLLCQSFAPNHVCIITPERLGLCGAYNWLDGKAAYEIDPTGPNQPVKKGECLDPVKGLWQGINDYVYTNSHKTLDAFCAYSIMDRPMTSCGCFEVICGYVPECNGVMAVNREYQGDTPVGMAFSTLAGNVGGGQQTPGFMGCGKVFLTSRKFLFAEGGHKRLVWMPKELKQLLAEDLKARFAEAGCPDLLDKIADETIATDPAEIRAFMEKTGHPALKMPDMTTYAQSAVRPAPAPAVAAPPAAEAKKEEAPAPAPPTAATADLAALKAQIMAELRAEMKQTLTREIVSEIIANLQQRFLGEAPPAPVIKAAAPTAAIPPKPQMPAAPAPARAAERIAAIKAFGVRREKAECAIAEVKLGATAAEGGTRQITYTIGGATCMPFHLWEGAMPHRPLVAMEVFDRVSEKYPAILREIYGNLLAEPAAMARACVEKYGADLISVRLDSTHPERGNLSAEAAAALVKEVLAAVGVPL